LMDGKRYEALEGQSVLQVALEYQVDIPHFCYHEDLPVGANCRICLVEVEGKVVTSCTLKVIQDLEVFTQTPRVRALRKKNLALLLAGHKEQCPRCQQKELCSVMQTLRAYEVDTGRYTRPKTACPLLRLATAAEIDPDLCIGCNQCVEVCQKMGVGFLKLEGQGASTHAACTPNEKIDCLYCGQCTLHCPVGAAREQSAIKEVEADLEDPEKIVIAQMAPSIRCSIGEAFGELPGKDMTGECYTALRLLGFDKVFDVNFGADLTTWAEAHELVERISQGGPLPMFTSCCPGWVKCAEFYYPKWLPHLTTARSPHMLSGAAYKTWWAKKEGVDPQKIVVVSIMPCTSKKYEASQEKFLIDGWKPVDHVLTTREFVQMLRARSIDLASLKKSEGDMLSQYSGAAAIYGASGGVMESALRTAMWLLDGTSMERVMFEEVRGMKGIKKAHVQMGGKTLRVAVCATKTNMDFLLQELEKDPEAYHYIEVMACPGGCIGGGGQPIPTTQRIIAKRIAGLYSIDDHATIRRAHENPLAKEFMEQYIPSLSADRQQQLLSTHYQPRQRFE